ncbi:MAG: hypothetical protein JKY56_20995 [Kofleriaceae bacterium]|nr:hypothetical protein [Kofleriaceae bacterium]
MNRKFLLTAALTMGSVLIPMASVTTAHAQNSEKDKALSIYRKGRIQYDLGRWKKAIALFEEAYGIFPDAAYLFNIAQSYRQSDDCKQAAFFYKRFLSIAPGAPNRREVEGYIRDLDETCRLRGQSNLTPPDTSSDPVVKTDPDPDANKPNNTAIKSEPASGGTQIAALSDNTNAAISTSGGDAPAESGKASGPSALVFHAYVGGSLLILDDLVSPTNTPKVSTQLRGNLTLGIGYPVQVGPVLLDLGVNASAINYRWRVDETTSGSVGFATVVANVGARYPIADKVMLRGEVGLGVMAISGLDDANNPFLNGSEIDGTLSSFAARLAIGGEYALTDSLAASVAIVFQGTQAPEGLLVDNLNSAQALVGVRYSL